VYILVYLCCYVLGEAAVKLGCTVLYNVWLLILLAIYILKMSVITAVKLS